MTEAQQTTPDADPLEAPPVEDVPSPGWRGRVRTLDVFWLVLTAILVAAVVFVVSVAHNSMNDVGTTATPHLPGAAPLTTPGTAQTLVMVQVSSYRSQGKARNAAADLADRGFQAKVLHSDDYSPMNAGWYVLYTGFYPDTGAGRAEAKRVAAKLPDAFIRDVHQKG